MRVHTAFIIKSTRIFLNSGALSGIHYFQAMSIVVNDLSYMHPDREVLFQNVSFSLATGQKASLIGDNGSGKSTLLKILSGEFTPSSGEVAISDTPYLVPQHFGQYDSMTIACALGIGGKIAALRAILAGDLSEDNYTALGDDWDIEERAGRELGSWGLGHVTPDTPLAQLSGGEKTRVFLAGTGIVLPSVVLMDEPTNHLDRDARERLYALVDRSPAAMLIVSHDRELLNLMDTTLELTARGVNLYGGNYDFYKAVRDGQLQALQQRIDENQKAVRAARKSARETIERKEKMDARGERKQKQAGVPRIMMNSIRDGAEKSGAKLKDKHTKKIEEGTERVRELRGELPAHRNLKIALDSSSLHKGKVLVDAVGINFGYDPEQPLWASPLDLRITSGQRLWIQGANGSGKTTLLKLITGGLEPTVGQIKRADFSSVYIDQEYSLIDDRLTVLSQLESYNRRHLPEHALKTELHRFLFPSATWDKPCAALSGGEKMRLMLCCLLVSNDTPDVFILDEPTNNLDISSMEILTSVISDYSGTVILISHDRRFAEEIGVDSVVNL